ATQDGGRAQPHRPQGREDAQVRAGQVRAGAAQARGALSPARRSGPRCAGPAARRAPREERLLMRAPALAAALVAALVAVLVRALRVPAAAGSSIALALGAGCARSAPPHGPSSPDVGSGSSRDGATSPSAGRDGDGLLVESGGARITVDADA